MALIECPECGKEISEQAVSCPQCAYPIQTQSAMYEHPVQTIEQTGKKWKAGQLVGAFMMVAAPVSLALESPTLAIALFFFGLAVYVGFRVGAWWGHG